MQSLDGLPTILVSLIVGSTIISTTLAQTPLYAICSNTTTFARNSTYENNLKILLSSLATNGTPSTGFYNASFGRDPDDVYGLYLCRGDIGTNECQQCVNQATSNILSTCPVEKQTVVWYDDCLLRYSNSSVSPSLEQDVLVYMWNTQNITGTNQEDFMQLAADTLSDVGATAALSSRKFAVKDVNFTSSSAQRLYTLTQCTPDLSTAQCQQCLQSAISQLPSCCNNRPGGRVLTPSCYFRYETYAFYNASAVYTFCSNTATFARNSTYENNLRILLSSLASNGTPSTGFYNSSAGQDPDDVYGRYLCRGDIGTDDCQQCVKQATIDILSSCPAQKQAVVWYDACLLRYSNSSVSPSMDQDDVIFTLNVKIARNEARFSDLLVSTLRESAAEAAAKPNRFLAKYVDYKNYTSNLVGRRLYVLTQCMPDISTSDCEKCLETAISYGSVDLRDATGGMLSTFSCYFRFEIYPFYNGSAPESPQPPSPILLQPPPPTLIFTRKRNKPTKIVLSVSISTTVGVLLLLGSCIYTLQRRKNRKKAAARETSQQFHLIGLGRPRHADRMQNTIIEEERPIESQDFPLIQLDIINEATQYFSRENKLGEGGFGPVYKGTLVDGKEIAVKRLSRNSGQGLTEFMNEVTLIARLQHRNLVRLVGCCLEKNENLLIYEYMPNRSLDMFLFDSSQAANLDWQRRLSIIYGVARGLLYLHEDSRLKIIHRDLKVSNILLDYEMNPKISDFGMARIFGGDQNKVNTNRVVGTYGYMAPEYAMEGLFSVKSDAFSFGVVVLEIISGKRNNGFYLSEQGESLLTYAWKMWSKGGGMELMDPLLTKSSDTAEVLKCIHIGLLCVQDNPSDRPSMSYVVVALASDTITLPQPSQPTFSVGRVSPISSKSSSDKVCSVSQVTLSNVSPR